MPTWRNGRRAAFRSQSFHEGEGSSPFVGTTFSAPGRAFFPISSPFFPVSFAYCLPKHIMGFLCFHILAKDCDLNAARVQRGRHGAMVCTHVSRRKTRSGLHGRLRQKRKDGHYYYRLTITNGTRKEFTLHTLNYDEAIQKASELDSIWLAPTHEVALAQMSTTRGASGEAKSITFENKKAALQDTNSEVLLFF